MNTWTGSKPSTMLVSSADTEEALFGSTLLVGADPRFISIRHFLMCTFVLHIQIVKATKENSTKRHLKRKGKSCALS